MIRDAPGARVNDEELAPNVTPEPMALLTATLYVCVDPVRFVITIPAERLPPAPLDSDPNDALHRIEPHNRGHRSFDVDETGTAIHRSNK